MTHTALWRCLVRCVGGIYEIGRHTLAIHDSGIMVAKDQVVSWEWPKRQRPPKARAERIADEDRLTRWSK